MDRLSLPSDPTLCVAFTGHRPEKIARYGADPCGTERHIRALLRGAVRELYDEGFRWFLSGMADGIDLWAADEVLLLRDEGHCPEIKLCAVIPFTGHRKTIAVQNLYDRVLEEADCATTLLDHYSRGCYALRNDFLVAHSCALIAYFEGGSGGTEYTILRARHSGHRIIDLLRPTLF